MKDKAGIDSLYIDLLPEQKQEQEKNLFERYPSGVPFMLTREILDNAPLGEERLRNLSNKSHGVTYTPSLTNGGKDISFLYSAQNGNIQARIDMENLGVLTNGRSAYRKIFDYVLSRTFENSSGGEFFSDTVTLTTRELVSLGIYKTTKGAREGLQDFGDIATRIRSSFKSQRGKTPSAWAFVPMFSFAGFDGRIYKIRPNLNGSEPQAMWKILLKNYSHSPKWRYQLQPKRSYSLCSYLFDLAGQNEKELSERGYFKVKIKTIAFELALPTLQETKNPGRDIREPIEKAVDEINALARQNGAKEEDFLLRMENYSADPKAFVENGYIEVHLSGSYLEPFKANADRRKQQEQKRKQIEEKAAVKNEMYRQRAEQKKKEQQEN